MSKSKLTWLNEIKWMISGKDGKLSINRVLAVFFSISFIVNVNKSVGLAENIVKLFFNERTIDAASIAAVLSSLAGISMILGIQAGLIAALLSLTTYSNIQHQKIDNTNSNTTSTSTSTTTSNQTPPNSAPPVEKEEESEPPE